MMDVLKAALYEEGYCEMTTDGDLLPPSGHASMFCGEYRDCWVCRAWRSVIPVALTPTRETPTPESKNDEG